MSDDQQSFQSLKIDSKKYNRYFKKICLELKAYPNFNFDPEDVTQSMFLNWGNGKGKHQTTKQFVIDYIRGRVGRAKDNSYGRRVDIYFAGSISEPKVVAGVKPVNHKFDCPTMELASKIHGEDRCIFLLLYKWGLTLAEVAECFNKSEAWTFLRKEEIEKYLRGRV